MASAFYRPAVSVDPTIGYFEITRRLGCYGRSDAWTVKYLDGLIREYGFPKPFPLEHRGKFIETAHPKSHWSRRAVEQWEHDRLPPDAAAAIDARELEEAGQRMDARAVALFAANDPDWPIEFPGIGQVRV